MGTDHRILKPHIGFASMAGESNPLIIKELLAGMEEENVPWEDKKVQEKDTILLAHRCAHESPLGVGLAVGRDGSVAVHIKQLPEKQPLFYLPGEMGNKTLWRIYGSHAARIVKGIPFKSTDESNGIEEKDQKEITAFIIAEIIKVMSDMGIGIRG